MGLSSFGKYDFPMSWKKCESCKEEFFQNSGDTKCPNCDGLITSGDSPKSPKEHKLSLVEQAKGQARVVGKFGEVLQIIGYVLIAVFSIGLIFSLLTSNWIPFIVFLVAIPATFIYYNVFGSAIRAVALYIEVKVK